MKIRKIVIPIVLIGIGLLTGCNNNSNESSDKSIDSNLQVSETPSSFEKYALLANGKITVNDTLETDGPLADIHSNKDVITSNARSIDIMGRMSAYDGISGNNFRSVEVDNLNSGAVVDFRALHVGDYDVDGILPDAYILKKDGTLVKRFHSQETLADKSYMDADLTFTNGKWTISGVDVKFDIPIKSETDLDIHVENIFIAGTLMVEGTLHATGNLNINTGTPFEHALIVDNSIELDSFECIGKVFASGNFLSHKSVNITGSAIIDGDIKLEGKTKVNYLDTVYQAAMSDAEDDFGTTDFMLAHSRLFSDLKGKNSVVLFTFVKGKYLINEETLEKLIETNQTDEFEFKSYLYGATLAYGSDLAKYEGLSPYYAKKLKVEKELSQLGYENLQITESLDISPQALYHTYQTKDGEKIGTYLIDSFSSPIDSNKLYPLSDEHRADAYNQRFDEVTILENKQKLEEERLETNKQIPNKNNIDLDSVRNDSNLTEEQKSEIIAFIEENSDDMTNELLEKQEAEQDRIKEWIYEKNIEGEIVTIEVEAVEVNSTKRWGGFGRWVKRKWRSVKKSVCTKKYYTGHLDYVRLDTTNSFSSGRPELEGNIDEWIRDIAYGNPSPGAHCTAVASAMSIRYLAKRYGKTSERSLYDSNFNAVRWDPADVNSKDGRTGKSTLVQGLSKDLGIRLAKEWERNAYDRYAPGFIKDHQSTLTYIGADTNKVPNAMNKVLKKGGISASIWNETNYGWWFARHKYFNKVKSDINNKTPVLMHIAAYQGITFHSVVVIGYKYKDYRGHVCRYVPNKNWFYLANGWNSDVKKIIRFDIRSNYFNSLPVSFTRMKIYTKTPAEQAIYNWWRRWFNFWW